MSNSWCQYLCSCLPTWDRVLLLAISVCAVCTAGLLPNPKSQLPAQLPSHSPQVMPGRNNTSHVTIGLWPGEGIGGWKFETARHTM
jgi:hypothetical protein